MLLNKKEKEKLAIKMLNEGKPTREVSQVSHLSFMEIDKINRKLEGKTESKIKSMRSKAYTMFSKGKSTIEVSIHHDIGYEEVKQFHSEYLSLNGRDNFLRTCKDHSDLLPFLNEIAKKMIKNELDKFDVDFLINGLSEVKSVHDYKNKLQHEVNLLTIKRDDLLDNLA